MFSIRGIITSTRLIKLDLDQYDFFKNLPKNVLKNILKIKKQNKKNEI